MNYPVTPAIRLLREYKVDFTPHLYTYEERGGTRHSAAALGFDEHHVIKTLVMETDTQQPLIVLMHGDLQVSTKQLARTLNVKSMQPATPDSAQKHTGYLTGGTSPFGTRAKLPVYAERTIFELPEIYINGGKRGFLVNINPQVLRDVLAAQEVDVGVGNTSRE